MEPAVELATADALQQGPLAGSPLLKDGGSKAWGSISRWAAGFSSSEPLPMGKAKGQATYAAAASTHHMPAVFLALY